MTLTCLQVGGSSIKRTSSTVDPSDTISEPKGSDVNVGLVVALVVVLLLLLTVGGALIFRDTSAVQGALKQVEEVGKQFEAQFVKKSEEL